MYTQDGNLMQNIIVDSGRATNH